MAMDYINLAKNILEKVGGKENILGYEHCATRLRFNLKDNKKAAKKEIERIEGVITVMEAAGQFQVVLGPKVTDVYREVQKLLPSDNLEGESSKTKKGIVNTVIDVISSVFTPILYTLIGSGILKGILAICTSTNILSADSGTYMIWNAAADSLYYFLPIILSVTCAKKFGANQFVSMAIAGALLYPNLVNVHNAGTAITFLNIPVVLTSFSSSVFPIIFGVLLQSYLEKKLNKIVPGAIKNFFIPLICLMVVVPATIMAFGPLGSFLSNGIASFYTSVYSFNKIIAGAFIGAVAQILVVFGIHWGLFPIIFANISNYGFDTILAVFGPSIVAQGGSALGVYLKTKDPKIKQLAGSASFISLFGISESAIYGINLKYKKPFIMAIIGGGIGGAIVGATGGRAIAVAVASIPAFPVYFGTGFGGFVIGYFGAFIISAVLTYFFGYDDSMNDYNPETEGKAETIKNTELTIKSPVEGEIQALDKVKDQAFASGAMGKGISIIPTKGKLISPVNGTLTAAFETGHAYGITAKNGEEILLHVGIDTVKLNGKFFKSCVKQGDIILEGDVLATFDLEEIKKAGYDPTVILIITNSNEDTKVNYINDGKIDSNTPLLSVKL